MTYNLRTTLLALLILVGLAWPVRAEVEWQVRNTMQLDQQPVDMQVSLNGQWIYVLNDQGELQIYKANGKIMDTLKVGTQVDQISVAPRDDILFLKSRKTSTIQVVHLTYIHDIGTAGSPFKGPASAPVTIAVFTDFQ